MERKKLDPFRLSVELDGVAAISCCLSMLFLNEGDIPSNEITGNALLAIETYLERIAADVCEFEKDYHPDKE